MTVRKSRRLPATFCVLLWIVCAATGQSSTNRAISSADSALSEAVAAANAGDLDRARSGLETAANAYPQDPRFPVELAGIAFLQKDFSSAKRWLHHARRLGSIDPYVDEFLGTLYLLDGNVEAALLFWNRIDRPVLVDDQIATGLESVLRTGLANDAASFRAGAVFGRGDYLRTQRVTTFLGVCGSTRVDLLAQESDRFRATMRCVERPGFGQNKLSSLVMLARGLGYQAVHVRIPNIGRRAWQWNSMLRWDTRKRRAFAETAMPIAGRSSWRLRIFADARHEYWQALDSDTRALRQDFLHRRAEAGVAAGAVLGSRTTWENSLSLANRSFPVVSPAGLANDRLVNGTSLRYGHRIESDLYRNPVKRFFVALSGDASLERYFTRDSNVIRGETSLRSVWLPSHNNDDGRTTLRVNAGALHGVAPLTDLFTVGFERDELGRDELGRDGSLPLRAHIGTRDGHKGSALYGDRYFNVNLDVEKTLLQAGVLRLSLAPFLDAAWVRDPARIYGARKVQFDAGIQFIAATPGGTEFRLSYGWNLRTKRPAFYTWTQPFP